ncbi:MAG: hypothetical protein H6624_17935 [Bdellovibrionaceae bacterium]|nr:hypothetical protein [Bdellovibrionales bacterium]MCB9086226.1 hypothetical protein [Pseudobdellovibrionaceae bacterium]
MTPVCPVCQSQIADDFGLINCPSCGASLFIEMDGQVRAYETNAIDSDEPPAGIQGIGSDPVPDVANEGEDEGVGIEMEWDDQAVRGGRGGGEQDQVPSESRAVLASMENWDSVPAVDIQGESDGLEMDDDSEAENNPPLESPVGDYAEGDNTEMLAGEDQVPTVGLQEFPEDDEPPPVLDDGGVSDFDELSGVSNEIGMAATEYVPESGGVGLEDMSNLSDFGNSEQSVGQSGPLRVRVRMEGIDSPELREDLRDALTDKKFLWDTEELMRSIDGGVLIIDNATPLKAAILIERVKSLPLEITWEQFAITQP